MINHIISCLGLGIMFGGISVNGRVQDGNSMTWEGIITCMIHESCATQGFNRTEISKSMDGPDQTLDETLLAMSQ